MSDDISTDDEGSINNHVTLQMDYFKTDLLDYLRRNGYNHNFQKYLDNETNILSNGIDYKIKELKKNIIDSTLINSSITTQKALCIIAMQNILLSIFASRLQSSKH